MTHQNERPWYKKPQFIIPLVVVILAAVISPILSTCLNKNPDFSISVDPLTGKSRPLGSPQTLIKIEVIDGYKRQVTLEAVDQPHGIVVTFMPIGGPTPPYSSTMTINVGVNVPPGEYPITIRGLGADGKEHTCKYILTILPEEKPDTCSLSFSVNPTGSGSVTGAGTYGPGTLISFRATPSPGYRFDHWSGDASGTNPEVKIRIVSDMYVVANFVEITQPAISITYKGGEHLTGTVSGSSLEPNSEYMLTLNGKIGQDGNEELLSKFLTEDGEGIYNFMRVKTGANGDVSSIFAVDDLPPGDYDVTFLVKETWNDWKPVYVKDHVVFTITAPSSLEITFPPDDSKVDMREIVRGNSQDIPEGNVIWVLIFPHEVGRYYPQDIPADIQLNGEWSSSVFIGTTGDSGKSFDVIAVLANQEAQDEFNDYLQECKDKQSWPGLIALPSGTDIYGRITVTRK